MIFRRSKTSQRFLEKFRGFTLLEVLISISLFAIITLGIITTIKQTTHLTERAKSREASVMSALMGMDRLMRDLEMAYNERLQRSPSTFKSKNGSLGPEIIFTTWDSEIKTLIRTRTSGLITVRYLLEKNEDGTMNLLRAEAPLPLTDKIEEQPTTQMTSGLVEWKLEFYDARSDQWSKEWDTQSPEASGTFPRAVRIFMKAVDPSLPKDKWKEKSLALQTEIPLMNEGEAR